MKVMVFVQIEPKDETGAMPSDELLAAMAAYNEELTRAGILLDVGGLKPTSECARVEFRGGTTSVIDGPFTESKEIVVGYWVWDVGSFEDALAAMDAEDVNARWQAEMAGFFEGDGGPADRMMRPLDEVFHLD